MRHPAAALEEQLQAIGELNKKRHQNMCSCQGSNITANGGSISNLYQKRC
jgi:hypothetical protein